MKNKSIKLALNIAFASTLSLASISSSAATDTVVYNGITYKVELNQYTDIFNTPSVLNLIQNQPWFESTSFDFSNLYGNEKNLEIISKFTSLPDQITEVPGQFPSVIVGFYNTTQFVNIFQNNGNISDTRYTLPGWILVAILGPSAADTLASMQPNASAMKNAFNSQYATLANGLNHDCTIFDTNGVCVSVFGRNTSLNDSSFDSNAGGLVLGFKPHAQFRIGTYIDQSLNSNTTGGVKVERSNPDVGVFGVWNMHADGSGFELRAAANYGKRDLNVNRSVVGSAEAGSGSSDLNAYGALLEASYAYAMNDRWTAKPYAGVRYLSIKRDGYTETTSADVQNPLSYSGLQQDTTSATLGLRLNGQLAPKVMASLSAGLEHDLHHSIDDYRATGVDGLGSIDMNSQKDRTRPTAGLGIAYEVADKQRVGASVQYRKEVFMSESSTTGQINYTIGF